MIRLEQIYKAYDKKAIFDGFNLNISEKLTRIAGANGSGKSTLLKIIAGKINHKGNVYIGSKKCSKRVRENNIILVNQDISLLENKTVNYNLKSLGLDNINNHELDFFDITYLYDKPVNELSGGQKKRLSLYIAFLLEPKIILLDEYSNYLDDAFIKKLNEYIIAYSKEHYVIYVDHKEFIGGNVIDLDSYDNSYNTNNDNICLKKGVRFSFYHFLMSFKPLNIISLFMVILLFTCLAISGSYSRLDMNLCLYDYYNQNSLSYFIYSDDKEIVPSYGSYYYGRRLSTKEKLELNRSLDSITYFDELSFDVNNELDGSFNKAYVFDYFDNASLLGSDVMIDGVMYKISGIIDYNAKLGEGFDNLLLNTIFINSEASDYDFISLDADADKLKSALLASSYGGSNYIKSNLEMNYNRVLYSNLATASFIVLAIIIILTEILNYKKSKKDICYLRQYGFSSDDLLLTSLSAIFVKMLVVGVIGYFVGDFIIKKYQGQLIIDFSKSFSADIPFILISLAIASIIMAFANVFLYLFNSNEK